MTTVEIHESQRKRNTECAIALADIYVATNQIRDRLEDRLAAIQRALDAGATRGEIAGALAGSQAVEP